MQVEVEEEDYITSQIGFLGVLHHYMRQLNLAELIDSSLEPGKNWQGASLGQVAEVFLLYLMHSPRSLYGAEVWVRQTPYLLCLYPDLQPKDLTDDRLGILLDKINEAKPTELYNKISIGVIKTFQIKLDQIHFDLTNFGLYGSYESTDGDPFVITYGFNKKKRADLKQVAMGVAVSSDGGVPISMQTYDGNTADVGTYLPFWKQLSATLQRTDFVYIGDCKLGSLENLSGISKGGGFFLTILARYAQLNAKLSGWLGGAPVFTGLRTEQDGSVSYRGFERSGTLADPADGKPYAVRYLVVWSRSLEATATKALDGKIALTVAGLETLGQKANRRQLRTEGAINAAADAILKKNRTEGFVKYSLVPTHTTVQKQVGGGKPGPKTQYETVVETTYTIDFQLDDETIANEKKTLGHFVMVTNQTAELLPLQKAFDAYKEEHKVENIFARANNKVFATVPMFLQLPSRINAMLFFIMVGVQLFTLVDRQIALKIAENKTPLTDILPNKVKSPKPKTEQMMDVFKSVHLIKKIYDGQVSWHISKLNDLQNQILVLLGVSKEVYYRINPEYDLILKSAQKLTET